MSLGRPYLFLVKLLGGVAAVALTVTALPEAVAHHGDIHATCDGNRPVITQRPPGTEHVSVICVDGLPEFLVETGPVATYDPVNQAQPRATPADFGGWVTVWLNDRPLKTPYDPIRGLQEPGPYLAASTGRVMMPVRFFTEAFGGEVSWNDSQRRATLKLPGRSRAINLWLDESQAMIGARQVDLDQQPLLFLDRMFVPVRFLAEGFGGEVEWDHSGRSAKVQLSGLQCTNPVYCGGMR